ncbi:MAG TPA: M3 family metallopeptidase [Hyphomicrobiaceae bacterium]|nr:M3 family metallopeptidase [Hyphomicrobiaceae bacterium]
MPRKSSDRSAGKAATSPRAADNPLLGAWSAPFAMPPFEAVRLENYKPAFAAAMREHLKEIAAITKSESRPTIANTIDALERSGRLLSRVGGIFYNLTGTVSTPELRAIERELAPLMAQHRNRIMLDAKLFQRIDDLHSRRARLKLDDEQHRVLERTHRNLVRAGAALPPAKKKRVAAINERLATLATSFAQNVLADEQAFKLILDGESDLAGLPDFARAAAKRLAADLGHEGKHAVTLARSSIETFLQFSARADLRAKAFDAWSRRGEMGGASDNREIITETLKLRAERAALLGYPTHAAFSLDDTMAKTPESVDGLLGEVWTAAKRKVGEEREALLAEARKEGSNAPLRAADWRYWAEKVRKARYDFDESELKPYLQLERMIEAAFDVAGRLFGLKFRELPDAPRYHPDVRVYEVRDKRGRHIGVFMGDYFARPTKRSGAWKSAIRSQWKLDGEVRPIILNVLNCAPPGEGQPALLSYDDARTLFHEFGHALHGLLSDVTYPSIAGTAVARDFVELPSQLYEHWLGTREVLEKHAVHVTTGQPMPAKLLAKLKAARAFNQGFSTTEFIASAMADMELHKCKPDELPADLGRFEAELFARIGMPAEVTMRHRLPHFQHIFSGGYASGYYSYMWSEVLDADAFSAFEEAGDVFDAKTAKKLKDHIYSAGNRRPPEEAYVKFRGRLPTPDAMLAKRGLKTT